MSRTRESRDRTGTGDTRRRLLSRAGGGLLGTAVAGGVGAETGAGTGTRTDAAARSTLDQRQDDDVAEQPLADVHTHLIPEPTFDRDPLSADELVSWMDEQGIDRAVVLALDSPESYPVQVPSWWLLEQAEPHSDRLVPFCTVDPRTLVYEDEAVALLERYVDRGARGVGELKAGLEIDDSRLQALYELCADRELPILFHTDEKAMIDDVGLPTLEDVLASFPEVDFVAHASGWWSHVSADVDADDLSGYPDRPVEPGGRVPELLGEYDNVYGDLSGPSGWNALARDPEYGQSFLEEHHERLLFGSDYVHPGQEIPQLTLFDRFDLPAAAWADVRYRNLEGLLE